MKIFTLSLLSLYSLALFSQSPPSIEWQRSYGGSLEDIGYSISSTSDGGYIVNGCTGSIDGDILKLQDVQHGSKCDYWYAKLDGSGNIQLKSNPGGTSSDLGRDAYEIQNGFYIIAGSSESMDVDVWGNHGSFDFWVFSVNNIGVITWNKCYGGSDYDDYGSMDVTSDGGFVLAGGTSSNNGDVSGNHGSSDFWLVKTDGNGNFQWAACYGGTGYEKAFDIKQTQDGGYILVGLTDSNDGQVTGNHSADYDGWVVKTDGTGTFQWGKCIGGTSQDAFYSVDQLPDQSYIVTGYSQSADGDVISNNGEDDALLVRLSPEGSLIWSKCFGGDSIDAFQSVKQHTDGHLLVSGYTRSHNDDLQINYGGYDYWLLQLDTNGIIQWDTVYGGSGNDVCYGMAVTSDGGVVLNGYTESLDGDVTDNHGKKDYWVIKLSNVVHVNEISKSAISISPNPSKDFISISGLNPKSDRYKYRVYGIGGFRMAEGEIVFQHSINIESFSSGIYYIEIFNEATHAVGKFVKQ